MTEPTREGRTIGVVVRWMDDWPSWVLIVCFIALAIVFATLGVLDDWARIALAVIFVAIALSLLARWRNEQQPPSL